MDEHEKDDVEEALKHIKEGERELAESERLAEHARRDIAKGVEELEKAESARHRHHGGGGQPVQPPAPPPPGPPRAPVPPARRVG